MTYIRSFEHHATSDFHKVRLKVDTINVASLRSKCFGLVPLALMAVVVLIVLLTNG